MKVLLNVFLIIVAGGAIFFSFQLSQKFEELQKARIAFTKEEAKVAANASAKDKERKDEAVALGAAKEKLTLIKASIDAGKATETSTKREIATVESTLAEQQASFASLDKTIAEVKDILGGLQGGVTMDNVGDQMVKMDADLKAKKLKADELTTLIDGAEKKIAASKIESKHLNERAAESSARISRNAKEAVVTAVNQDWGFLVIGAGSNSGFAPQTSLLVKRDGKLIGRVRPTSVEATQTIADIDLDSLASGVTLQPGDRVILATPAAN